MLAVFGSFCARQCAYEDNIQLNLSTTATMGTEERGRCKGVLSKSQCMDFFVRRDEKSGRSREVAVSRGSTVPKNTKHGCTTNDGALAPVFDMTPFAMFDFSLTVRQQKSSLIFFKSNAVFFQLSLQGLEIIKLCHCKHDRYLCTIH